ncbi:MAG: pyridoxal-phosphate dependent enzyme [Armatimonadetes bacterium]|nr:pyridoxal-phosphate dependent enzyme [Armatimonadota bacterium]
MTFESISLFPLPTPLHRLERLDSGSNCELWVKRDDLTGFAMGGNKGRKLQYLAHEIKASSCDVVVSCGQVQSNFLRQLGATCAVLGVECVAVCMERPYQDLDRKPNEVIGLQGGNLALDEWTGLQRKLIPDGTWDAMDEAIELEASRLRDQGKKVKVIPLGGSSPQGVHAFYEAGKEISQQVDFEFDFIVAASSSGSTQVGLTHYFRGSKTKVIGIAVDPEPEVLDDMVLLSESYVQAGGVGPALTHEDLDFRLDWVGPGYGSPSEAGNLAIELLAKKEGILLDPVYTGKAFAALLDLAHSGEISGRILFWHTGGNPALFAY